LSYRYPVYVIRKENSEKFFPMPGLTHMHQLAAFSELSNDVDTTGTGPMLVVASGDAISHGCPASF
jgi:hypothetical protein